MQTVDMTLPETESQIHPNHRIGHCLITIVKKLRDAIVPKRTQDDDKSLLKALTGPKDVVVVIGKLEGNLRASLQTALGGSVELRHHAEIDNTSWNRSPETRDYRVSALIVESIASKAEFDSVGDINPDRVIVMPATDIDPTSIRQLFPEAQIARTATEILQLLRE